jgi:hypothetical protein
MRALRVHWRLALAIGLIGAQAGIVAVGLFAPRVSPGYRALFIDKTMMTEPYDGHTFVWPGPDRVPETAVTRAL